MTRDGEQSRFRAGPWAVGTFGCHPPDHIAVREHGRSAAAFAPYERPGAAVQVRRPPDRIAAAEPARRTCMTRNDPHREQQGRML
jgi:hypothetical protein